MATRRRLPGYPGGGQIGYMISDDPMSWPKETYAGVLFPNQSQFFGAGTGGNNHQSVFEFEGKYYFTYHAPTLNKRINGNTTQGYRSPHIQELTFNADGTIQQVVGTYAGVEQVRDFDPYRIFEAETFGWSKGIATAKVAGALRAVRRDRSEPRGQGHRQRRLDRAVVGGLRRGRRRIGDGQGQAAAGRRHRSRCARAARPARCWELSR